MHQTPKSLFLSHGGGPLPLLGDPAHHDMLECLGKIARSFPAPSAIVLVSAHWEEEIPTITAAPQPPLIYDYYGFPPEAYELQYPCKGEPALAGRLQQMLNSAGIEARLNETRGFDHGLFVPLKIMYPAADIPCVQLSLVKSLDPSLHIQIGQALRELHKSDILLIGSGFSFHNLKAFFAPDNAETSKLNQAFEDWLQALCCESDMTEEERSLMLARWAEAPGARFCHPREEHLLPLHVCYGAAQGPCADYSRVRIMNKEAAFCLW